MKIAIPMANGRLAMHFGHCGEFAFITVDDQNQTITGREDHVPPPHEPGALPRWLAERGVNTIIAGGMGQRAQALFAQSGIEVIIGASSEDPETLVGALLQGTLATGENICDH